MSEWLNNATMAVAAGALLLLMCFIFSLLIGCVVSFIYDWCGDWRESKPNPMSNAEVEAIDSMLEGFAAGQKLAEDLQPYVVTGKDALSTFGCTVRNEPKVNFNQPWQEAKKEFELVYLSHHLDRFGGNKKKLGEFAGWSQQYASKRTNLLGLYTKRGRK